MAFGALQEARARGIRIPEDLAIIGFDDHPMSEMLGLSTIRQPVDTIGALAGQEALVSLTAASFAVTHHVVATELVVRSTT